MKQFSIPLPFIILSLYLIGLVVLKGVIPQPDVLIELVKNLYGTYGYWIVFIGAILEGMFLISLYVPGSVTVLLGAALARTGILQFPVVMVLAIAGFLIGYAINYFLGKYGWYQTLSRMGLEKGIEEAKKRLQKNIMYTIFIGYFHPSGASFLSTAAGILRIPFKRFFILSCIAQTFWAIVWGSLAYIFGMPLVEFFLRYFGYAILVVVVLWFIIKFIREKIKTV